MSNRARGRQVVGASNATATAPGKENPHVKK